MLKAACVLLWQQPKVPGSIYFTRDKVVDFPKSGYILLAVQRICRAALAVLVKIMELLMRNTTNQLFA